MIKKTKKIYKVIITHVVDQEMIDANKSTLGGLGKFQLGDRYGVHTTMCKPHIERVRRMGSEITNTGERARTGCFPCKNGVAFDD
jgi:hypothetical protein